MIDPKKSSMILLICKPEINTKVKIMPMHDNRIFKSIVIIFLNSIYFSVKINAPAHTINSAITEVKAAADAPQIGMRQKFKSTFVIALIATITVILSSCLLGIIIFVVSKELTIANSSATLKSFKDSAPCM